MKKRLFFILLCAALLFAALPCGAMAAGTPVTSVEITGFPVPFPGVKASEAASESLTSDVFSEPAAAQVSIYNIEPPSFCRIDGDDTAFIEAFNGGRKTFSDYFLEMGEQGKNPFIEMGDEETFAPGSYYYSFFVLASAKGFCFDKDTSVSVEHAQTLAICDEDEPTNGIVVVALFDLTAPKQVTLTLDAGGGTCKTASVTTGADGKAASLPAAAADGAEFDGWYTLYGNKVTPDTVFYTDMTLYAHYKGDKLLSVKITGVPEPAVGKTIDEVQENAVIRFSSVPTIDKTGAGIPFIGYEKVVDPALITAFRSGNDEFCQALSEEEESGSGLEELEEDDVFENDSAYLVFTVFISNKEFDESFTASVNGRTTRVVHEEVNGMCVLATLVELPYRYDVNVNAAQHGTVTVSTEEALVGETVTLIVSPEKYYTLETLTVKNRAGKELALTEKGSNIYTFKMPAGKVDVTATFMDDNSTLRLFVDVKPTDWFHDAVMWAARNDITTGTDDTHFSPNLVCTRAQMVTFLWRAAGSPVVNYKMPFTDLKKGAYYTEAVRWASSCGITKGTSKTTFSPDGEITREQLAAFIFNYDKTQVHSSSASVLPLPDFDDASKISGWAKEGVCWCVLNGIIHGVGDNMLAPQRTATRAEIVTMLYRYFEFPNTSKN